MTPCRTRTLLISQSGFTYLEILVAATVLALGLIPAVSALQTATQGSAVVKDFDAQLLRMSSTMEEILAQPYSQIYSLHQPLTAGVVSTLWSDADESASRIVVYIEPYDADNLDADDDVLTGTDDGILRVTVAWDGTDHQLQSLVAE